MGSEMCIRDSFATGLLGSYFLMYLLNVYSVFKVREVFALTNQLGTFFGNNKENFKKIFSTTFQGQRKPLSHHGAVIGAETEKAR